MSEQVTESLFLHDVRSHVLEVIRDDGVHRHLRFRRPETTGMHFDLITWPGYLCYTGDMGTYVFRRLDDMFEFFRTDADSSWLKRNGLMLGINPGYWAEKLEAQDRVDGLHVFSEKKFSRAVIDHLVSWMRDNRDRTTKEERRVLWSAVINEVVDAHGDSNGYRKQAAAHDFYHKVNETVGRFEFSDFCERTFTEYSYRFMWCCYALAWSIGVYDASKELAAVN